MLAGAIALIALAGSGARAEASVDYLFLEYDQPKELSLNGFAGGAGVSSANLGRTRVTDTRVGGSGGALRIDYDVNPFEFYFEPLWGDARSARNYLDLDDFYRELALPPVALDRLDLWVRGSGSTSDVHSVKVEFKDEAGRTVHRYIEIPDAGTAWTELSLPLDFANTASWSGDGTIDRRRLKHLTFIVERHRNPHGSGRFFLDEVAFVDLDATPLDPAAGADAVLERISLRAFQYFLDWYDPATGLWQDRSEFADLFSVAATGFGLSALAVGDARGWIDHGLATARVRHTLRKLLDGQQAGSTPAQSETQNGFRGFYYHFLGDEGQRKDAGSELSSIDTALLLMGVLHVREHFATDQEIVDLADAIYRRVQWPWMLSATGLFHHAWSPDCGGAFAIQAPEGGCFSTSTWDATTDEVILIDLLAIGSPTHGVPADVFYAWTRERGGYGGQELTQTWFGSLFTAFFAHQWIDFDPLGLDGHPDPAKRVDWHQNAVAAALANRQFVIDRAGARYPAYGPDSWGLTAAEAPGLRSHPACSSGAPAYCSYGALPALSPDGPFHDGTIPAYGAAGVATLVPDLSVAALLHHYGQTDLWRERFGLGDAYNLDPERGYLGTGDSDPWYNRVLFGIDEGPLLLGIDSLRGGATRAEVMRNPSIQAALCTVFCEAPPVLTDSDPDSPANDNNPRVKGTAAAGTIVRLYAGGTCAGPPVAEGPAAAFATPGLAVSVPDNSTTTFRGTATDASGITSVCSPSSITYVEDSRVDCSRKARKVQRPLRQKGIIVTVRCRENATVRARSSVTGAGKRVRLRPVTRRISAGERARLKLRLQRSGERKIRRAFRHPRRRNRVKATVSVTFTDAVGNVTAARRFAVRLRR